jgi:hypothetical protein
MTLNLIGLSLNSIVRITIPRLNLNILQSTIVTHSLSCLTNFGMACDGPVLFLSKFLIIFNFIINFNFFKVENIKKHF